MKRIILLFSLVFIIQNSLAQINNYQIGDTVNDFSVVDVYGNTHNLYTYTAQGKFVFIDFFYAACGGCQNFVSVFNEFYDKYGCNEGEVVCLAINSGVDKDQVVIDFENTYGGAFNHAPAASRDGGSTVVNDDFDPIYYPACVLIGPDNTVVNDNVNPLDGVADLEAAFPVGFNPQPLNCSLGSSDFENHIDFAVFPNPIEGGEVFLSNPKSLEANITIYDLIGKVVYKDSISGTQKTITTNFGAGTYVISINTNQGATRYRLILQ